MKNLVLFTIVVMSFNIRLTNGDNFDGANCWNNRREAVVKLINAYKPSFLGVQEAVPVQVSYLLKNLPNYGKIGVGRDDGLSRGEACALFYNKELYTVVDSGTFWLSETPDTVSQGWDAAYKRVVTWGKFIDKVNGEVFVFNTHFDHIGQVARRESSKLLINKINQIAGKDAVVFVTADFNSSIQDKALMPLRERFVNARSEAALTDSLDTYNGWGKGSGVIDHIFCQRALPLEFKTITDRFGVEYPSDHYPVMVKAQIAY